MSDALAVVFCFDEKFAPYAGVAIASALANADAQYKIYCLYSGRPERFPAEIGRLAQRYRCEIVKVDVPAGAFQNWLTSEAYSPAVYHRLLIPQVVTEPRAIYLDCDIVVTCGLSAFYAHDLEGAWFGGRPDLNSTANNRLDLPKSEPYLNSGVLLMDTRAIAAHRPLSVIETIYRENIHRISWPDQCLINKLAQGKKSVVDPRWNVQLHAIPRDKVAEELAGWDGNAVIHFSGPAKPWMQWAPAAARELWSRYARIAGYSPDALLIPATEITHKFWLAAQQELDGKTDSALATWRELAYALVGHIGATQASAA